MDDQNEKLFAAGPDWQLNACVNYAFDDLYAYAEGYKRAADILTEQLVANPSYGLDFAVYPLVFLYRHAIELQLKGIIRDGKRILGKGARPGQDSRDHRLDRLWRLARPILEEVWPGAAGSTLDTIDRVLRELSQADPDSQAFRYDRDRKGLRTKPMLTHVNIEQFGRLAQRTYGLLDGATTGLSELLDAAIG